MKDGVSYNYKDAICIGGPYFFAIDYVIGSLILCVVFVVGMQFKFMNLCSWLKMEPIILFYVDSPMIN